MRHSALYTVLISCAFSFAPIGFAQQSKLLTPHKPAQKPLQVSLPFPTAPVLRTLVGGLWMTDKNTKSSIYLHNGLATSPLTVTPAVYLNNGTKILSTPIVLEPSGNAVVSINNILADHQIAPYAQLSGYIEVEYKWAWSALGVTIRNIDTAHSLLFNYTVSLEHLDEPDSKGSVSSGGVESEVDRTVEGMWWKESKDVAGFVVLSNPTSAVTEVTVKTSDISDSLIAEHRITVPSHETKTISLGELTSYFGGAGGVSVSYRGGPGRGLLIHGGLVDSVAGYSANIPFISAHAHQPRHLLTPDLTTYSVAELGLLVGAPDPMMSFPVGTTFTPYSVIRNVSGESVIVKPTLYIMKTSASQAIPLPPLTLLPHSTHKIDLPSLMDSGGLSNTNGSVSLVLDIPKAALPDVIMASGSVDKKQSYVFAVQPSVVSEDEGKVLSYWSTANQDDTMVTLWNPADEDEDLTFTLFYKGGHYKYPLHLGPKNTRSLNISEIIQNQLPDSEGNVIPTTVHEGSARLSGANGNTQRILVGFDASTYNVKKATCGRWYMYCGDTTAVFVNPNSVYFGMDDGTTTAGLIAQATDGTQYNPQLNSLNDISWSSSDTTIAYPTGQVQNAANPGTLAAASQGTFNLTGTYQVITVHTYHGDYGSDGQPEGEPTSCPMAPLSGGAPGRVDQVNVKKLVADAKTQLSAKCDQKFSQVIPGYSRDNFFTSLGSQTFLQYPYRFFGMPHDGDPADAITDANGINLLPNFYGRDHTTQGFVITHEGIHTFTKWDDATVFANFKNYGLTNPSGNTNDITVWIQGGCLP